MSLSLSGIGSLSACISAVVQGELQYRTVWLKVLCNFHCRGMYVQHRACCGKYAVCMLQAADKALTQAAEQRAELKEHAQQLRAAEQDLRQRQREAAERDSELKAFEHNLTVSVSS